jgi:hypothetical protein
VAATRSTLLVIADTENLRVRQTGPDPLLEAPAPGAEVVLACRPQTSTCRRLSAAPAAAGIGTVTISRQGVVFATGRSFVPVRGGILLRVTEERPLDPGRYDLVIIQAGRRPQQQPIWIDHAPEVVAPRRETISPDAAPDVTERRRP